jgi:hypothetical protein
MNTYTHPFFFPRTIAAYDHYIIHQTNSIQYVARVIVPANHVQDTSLYKPKKFLVLLLIPTIYLTRRGRYTSRRSWHRSFQILGFLGQSAKILFHLGDQARVFS